jgi:hypothetical protein
MFLAGIVYSDAKGGNKQIFGILESILSVPDTFPGPFFPSLFPFPFSSRQLAYLIQLPNFVGPIHQTDRIILSWIKASE